MPPKVLKKPASAVKGARRGKPPSSLREALLASSLVELPGCPEAARGDLRRGDILEAVAEANDRRPLGVILLEVADVNGPRAEGFEIVATALGAKDPKSEGEVGLGEESPSLLHCHLCRLGRDKCSGKDLEGYIHLGPMRLVEGPLPEWAKGLGPEVPPPSPGPPEKKDGTMGEVERLAGELGFPLKPKLGGVPTLGGEEKPVTPGDVGTPRRESGGSPPLPLDGMTPEKILKLQLQLEDVRRRMPQPVKQADLSQVVAQRAAGAAEEKKSKKKKRRRSRSRERGRRRGRGSSSSRSQSRERSESSDSPGFRRANKIKRIAFEKPGELLLRGVQAIREVLEKDAIVAGEGGRSLQPVFLKYYNLVIEPVHQGTSSVRNLRELRTLATALDMLIEGQQVRAMDLLVQRFKALELAMQEGGVWTVAQHLELLPTLKGTVVQEDERELALKQERRSSKLKGHLFKDRDKFRG